MINLTLPKKYTEALFQVASEQGRIEEVGNDVAAINHFIKGNEKLKKIINHPGINKDEKRSLISRQFRKSVSKIALDFIFLLIDKKRETILPAVVELYSEKVDDMLGVKKISIETAYVLSPSEKEKVIKQLEKQMKKKLTVDAKVNEGIMGGIIIRDKMTVIDGSVKQFYESLKHELKMTKAVKTKKKAAPKKKAAVKKKAATKKKAAPKKKKK